MHGITQRLISIQYTESIFQLVGSRLIDSHGTSQRLVAAKLLGVVGCRALDDGVLELRAQEHQAALTLTDLGHELLRDEQRLFAADLCQVCRPASQDHCMSPFAEQWFQYEALALAQPLPQSAVDWSHRTYPYSGGGQVPVVALVYVVPDGSRIVDDQRTGALERAHHPMESRKIEVKAFHLVDEDRVHVGKRDRVYKPLAVLMEHARELASGQIVPVHEEDIVVESHQGAGKIIAVILIDAVFDGEMRLRRRFSIFRQRHQYISHGAQPSGSFKQSLT